MNGKYRVLFLKKMFLKLTDSEHYLSMSMIIANLAKNGFSAGKRTIKEDIDALIYMGYDIEYIYNKGYHLKSRTFSLSVLKMLADAVASFRFLTVKDSEKLLKLLESLCSIYEAPLLRREIMLTNRVKSDNEHIFDNIDMINSALHNNQQISFDYYDYDINKQLVLRDGVKRTCSPFALVMCNEQYYVVSNYEKHGGKQPFFLVFAPRTFASSRLTEGFSPITRILIRNHLPYHRCHEVLCCIPFHNLCGKKLFLQLRRLLPLQLHRLFCKSCSCKSTLSIFDWSTVIDLFDTLNIVKTQTIPVV